MVVGTLVRLEGVSREYEVGDAIVHALREVSLEILEGQFVVLLGPQRLRQDDPSKHDRRS